MPTLTWIDRQRRTGLTCGLLLSRAGGDGHQRVPFGCYKIGRVAAGADVGFGTNDVTHDPRVHSHEWAEELGRASFAGYRIIGAGGETTGVLALFSKRVLSPQDESLLQGLANTTSQVICAARAEEELRHRRRQPARRG